jgi:hypothetical protein
MPHYQRTRDFGAKTATATARVKEPDLSAAKSRRAFINSTVSADWADGLVIEDRFFLTCLLHTVTFWGARAVVQQVRTHTALPVKPTVVHHVLSTAIRSPVNSITRHVIRAFPSSVLPPPTTTTI